MPLFPVYDRNPALSSLRSLELVLSTGLSLSMTKESRPMQGCPWWGTDGPRRKGLACPGPSLLGPCVAGTKTDLVCVPCRSQGWASWPQVNLLSSKPPRVLAHPGDIHSRYPLNKHFSFPFVALHDTVILSWAFHYDRSCHVDEVHIYFLAGTPCKHQFSGSSALRIRNCLHNGMC